MTLISEAMEFLTILERAEVSLLTWGLVDGFFAESEIEQRAEEFLAVRSARGLTTVCSSGWDLVEALLERRLLWKVPDSDRYRTRMAEAVRLFARLRQIFPDARNAAWRAAPGLVADYRLLVRPRTYPRRDEQPRRAIETIRREVGLSSLQESVMRGLVRADTPEERALAGFQVRAATRVLRSTDSDRSLGTIVCAGTGSGKTLAFYLPAYAAMANQLSPEFWTKCLALYPRNELLKDQLREALANARRVAPVLQANGRRKFVLGALFGDVPRSANYILQGWVDAWRRLTVRGSTAYECPFVRCPRCSEPMAWLEVDLRQPIERLVCTATSCAERVEPDEIRLTRDRMLREPPDILFTTTEMLNQRMSSGRFASLFGIGARPERRPSFVLLDEVHTYEGTHGAHVALLLRRWRRAADARPHFVGLSATLADAPRFFADLAGIGPGDVGEVSPHPSEMEAEGAEYMLALRGDPSSGTSLLSTTIQAAMLLRRVLAAGQAPGAQGKKVFAFTDNLDVINRLYHTLLDAEGWDSQGRPNPGRAGGSLANIRATTLPNARERLELGQNWALVEDIGHVLAPGSRVRIGRTSSQDAGVDPNAEVIVATSSLEVGFDDPEVGAVLQHKAPQSSAGFLQRKGRAGRRRDMRPWTVVVLSDYGRDRSAYQGYDQLFSPHLPPRHLPLGNRAVLRMQATYALIDWVSRRLPPARVSDPWRDLSQPADEIENQVTAQEVRTRQALYAENLRALLEHTAVRADFAAFLARSLAVDEETVTALLWEPPRALLTEAVPTLLRRLERGWRRAAGPGFEFHVARAPLPEFVPRALFSDLQLPEVSVRLPQFGRIPSRGEPMPLAQALREFAPGRVSRRFGIAHSAERHWIDPGSSDDVVVDHFCPTSERQALGLFRYIDGDTLVEVPVVRPYAITTTMPPPDVQQSSNAFLDWHVDIVPTGEGHEADTPDGTAWTALLTSLRFHTHHLGQPLELRRFATGATASIGRGKGRPIERRLRFVFAGTGEANPTGPAALGFVADVDGVQVTFAYPHVLTEVCQRDLRLVRGLRAARFRDLLRTAPQLDGIANNFQRDWLSQAYLSSLTAEALRSGCTLREAEAAIRGQTSPRTVTDVLETLLQWGESEAETENGNDDAPSNSGAVPKRLHELSEILERGEAKQALHEAAHVLWEPITADWETWLRARFKSTLAAALVEAAADLCPRMDPDALVVDLDARPAAMASIAPGETDELWLTEATIGGGGFVEEFLSRYAEDPRRFFRLMDAALAPSDLEAVGTELERVLGFVTSGLQEHEAMAAAFAGIRQSDSHSASATALANLRRELARSGIPPTPTLLVSLNARVLRPGTSSEMDAFLARAVRDWDAAELRLGIDIDARVFALVRSSDHGLEQTLGVHAIGDSDKAREAWRYGVLYGMLWPRGAQVRSESLRSTSPFARLPDCDRLLVVTAVSRRPREVDLGADGWFDELARVLVREGAAELIGSVNEPDRLATALLRIACDPVDSEALLVHARLTGIQRDGDRLRAGIELPEAFQ